MKRILVAVHDSPPSLAAAHAAIALATEIGATLRFIAVQGPDAQGGPTRMVDHVAALARRAGVDATSEVVIGAPPFEVLLRDAATWNADIIVMGRSDAPRPGGAPRVGGTTEHLIEFATVPVLVVPEGGSPASS